MSLPSSIVAAMASARSRRRRSDGRGIVTAVGRGFTATLLSDMRGPMLTRSATTWKEAIAAARDLLDEAERREWHRGERVSVQIAQAED